MSGMPTIIAPVRRSRRSCRNSFPAMAAIRVKNACTDFMRGSDPSVPARAQRRGDEYVLEVGADGIDLRGYRGSSQRIANQFCRIGRRAVDQGVQTQAQLRLTL